MSSQLSAHAITAHTAMTRISVSRCSTLPAQRGSASAEKCSTSFSTDIAILPSSIKGEPAQPVSPSELARPFHASPLGQQLIRDVLSLAQGGDGASEIPRIPEDNRGDQQVEAGGAMLLVLVGAVADYAQPMDEDRPREAVAGVALVEFLAGRAPHRGVLNPVQREQCALQPSQLAQRCGDAVLPRVGGKLPHDQRRRHGAGADGRDDAKDPRPGARMRATLMRPAIIGSNAGWAD